MVATTYWHVPRNHPVNTVLLEMRRRASIGLVCTPSIRWHVRACRDTSLMDCGMNALNFSYFFHSIPTLPYLVLSHR